jgi:glyceraldehyde-3-phosphate dehydrogenase/erythrose-4-phosphate dehydrogenase
VHVVGTGTIGEPLIGLLADYRKDLGIDKVTFFKRTPLEIDRSKVLSLQERGAELCVERKKKEEFEKLGMEPTYDREEGIDEASVVIDCTPPGNGERNKELFYKKYQDGRKGFIAQGSEKKFGKPYAYGINDGAIDPEKNKYTQVVSCNTHNIAAIVDTFALESCEYGQSLSLGSGRFHCARRGTDISEDKGIVPSPKVEEHVHPKYGTHQAEDAARLFSTIGWNDLDIFSSAMKINSQYMHVIWFDLILKDKLTIEDVHSKILANRLIGRTYKTMTSLVSSFGRDHGYYGRILNQTVIVLPTLLVRNGNEVIGYSFTPQDGNSLLSSVAAAEHYLYPNSWREKMKCLDKYLFKEI